LPPEPEDPPDAEEEPPVVEVPPAVEEEPPVVEVPPVVEEEPPVVEDEPPEARPPDDEAPPVVEEDPPEVGDPPFENGDPPAVVEEESPASPMFPEPDEPLVLSLVEPQAARKTADEMMKCPNSVFICLDSWGYSLRGSARPECPSWTSPSSLVMPL
jgi:hypothetical protein